MKHAEVSAQELRKFGLTIGVACVVLGGWLWFRHKPAWPYLLGGGGLLTVLGLIAPVVLRPLFVVWMKIADVMGFVMTRVIVSVVFFLVVTPIGCFGRLFGKRFLELELDRSAASHWRVRDGHVPGKDRYESQF